MTPEVALRPYDASGPGERSFVVASWVRSHQESQQARALGPCYLSRWTAVVDDLLSRSSTVMAVDPSNPSLFIGFLCGALPGTVHYVFVKSNFRRFGVARLMVETLLGREPGVITYTHQTQASSDYTGRHAGVIYDNTRLWLPTQGEHHHGRTEQRP